MANTIAFVQSCCYAVGSGFSAPLLWIQSLPHQLQGLLGGGLYTFGQHVVFLTHFVTLFCHDLIRRWGFLSQWECIHHTTLWCIITPHSSSIRQWCYTYHKNGSCTAVWAGASCIHIRQEHHTTVIIASGSQLRVICWDFKYGNSSI